MPMTLYETISFSMLLDSGEVRSHAYGAAIRLTRAGLSRLPSSVDHESRLYI